VHGGSLAALASIVNILSTTSSTSQKILNILSANNHQCYCAVDGGRLAVLSSIVNSLSTTSSTSQQLLNILSAYNYQCYCAVTTGEGWMYCLDRPQLVNNIFNISTSCLLNIIGAAVQWTGEASMYCSPSSTGWPAAGRRNRLMLHFLHPTLQQAWSGSATKYCHQVCPYAFLIWLSPSLLPCDSHIP
jgi:hypothetical protein